MQIVDAGQHGAEHFAAAVEVVEVGAAETAGGVALRVGGALAGVAGAGRVHRAHIAFVPCVAHFQVAKAGEHMAVAGVAGGHDAIEHVDAALHTGDQIFWGANAHEVVRLVGRQLGANVLQHAHHVVFGLAHAQASHGNAGEVQGFQACQRFVAQAFKHAALHDAEQRVGVIQTRKFFFATLSPAQAQLHRHASLFVGSDFTFHLIRRAFVKLHGDVAVQNGLNLHRHFRCEKQFVAVDWRGKAHAFFADLAHLAQ